MEAAPQPDAAALSAEAGQAPVAAWSVLEVASWMRGSGISGAADLAQRVLEEQIDGEALLDFDSKRDVKEGLGLPLGIASKVWKAIESLKINPAEAPISDSGPIQLWVKMPTGQTVSVTAKNGAGTSVADVRAQLAAESDVDASSCRLIFAGQELDDELTLADYDCAQASELHLFLRVSQGDTVAEADSSVDVEAQRETAALRALMVGKKLQDFTDFVKIGGKDIAAVGGGGYSQNGVCSYVYKATPRQCARKTVVLKVMLNYDTADSTLALGTEFDAEIALLSDPVRLPAHRHVMAVLHSFADTATSLPGWNFDPSIVRPRTMIVVMPFFPTDLKAVLQSVRRHGGNFADVRAARIVYQLLLAVRHLKANEIVHRDIKLDNVLLSHFGTADERAVLTDFGMCFDLKKNAVQHFRVMIPYDGFRRGGAPIALAPEVTLPTPGPGAFIDYSKNDEWAVGMVAHELFSPSDECSPFDDMEHPASYRDEGYTDVGISERCQPLVRELLRVDVSRRLEASQGSRRAKQLLQTCESDDAAAMRTMELESRMDIAPAAARAAPGMALSAPVEPPVESPGMALSAPVESPAPSPVASTRKRMTVNGVDVWYPKATARTVLKDVVSCCDKLKLQQGAVDHLSCGSTVKLIQVYGSLSGTNVRVLVPEAYPVELPIVIEPPGLTLTPLAGTNLLNFCKALKAETCGR